MLESHPPLPVAWTGEAMISNIWFNKNIGDNTIVGEECPCNRHPKNGMAFSLRDSHCRMQPVLTA